MVKRKRRVKADEPEHLGDGSHVLRQETQKKQVLWNKNEGFSSGHYKFEMPIRHTWV